MKHFPFGNLSLAGAVVQVGNLSSTRDPYNPLCKLQNASRIVVKKEVNGRLLEDLNFKVI